MTGQEVHMDETHHLQPTSPLLVARRLTALRSALGINKADFADAIGIDRSSYTKIEKGEKALLPPKAYEIFTKYRADLNYIYCGELGGLPNHLSSKITKHLNGPKL